MTEWKTAHEMLSRLARERAAADAEEGRWLLRAQRAATHVHLGIGSFIAYVEQLFGYKPRSILEKLRVAEALEQLPQSRAALEQGRLSWSALREITRVAVRETEREWLELARGKSVRQLEELVAGKRQGDLPSATPDPRAARHVLRFEVSPEAFALFREALAELRRRSNASIDDDAALMEMARSVLGGPLDEGRSSYQIALSVCPECGSGRQPANGQVIGLTPEMVQMAECDAQRVPAVEPAHVGARAKQDIPPALRRAVLQRDERRCRVPGCRNATFLDLHHLQPRAEGGRHTAENLVTVCSAHHRALHRGELRSEGDAVHFRVLPASPGHGLPAALTLDVEAKVYSGLCQLGFRAGRVRAVLAELRRRDELAAAPPQQWLREALNRLRSSSAPAARP